MGALDQVGEGDAIGEENKAFVGLELKLAAGNAAGVGRMTGGVVAIGSLFFGCFQLAALANEEPCEDSGQEYGKNNCYN
jgi:hypothetical protein